ncbi:hypothetical protein GCM10011344_07840 [Dokdonia pacifica]|uniref:Uncharacterized protein n=1 Tax=Dokdonia pacifica TaxID=1627892 RepID=A0A238YXG6_9FLAO|nr:hypothetical protein [Dokdonia pacifica]GGG09665.1 hypothetical protein GCM10011344_07840 [Dokdonia pacifica]SNR75451.1 hypothetical protein SAMN06265376_102415 [Dokdonia pacifica]
MLKQYDLDICTMSIYENYVINQIKEGVHLEIDHVESLEKLINKHINYQPFVYISFRKNSYSFDPLVHHSINNIKNLKTFIIITDDKAKLNIVEFEKRFSEKNLLVVESLDEAISCVNEIFNKVKSA